MFKAERIETERPESEATVPRFLCRYRALHDPNDSLHKILANNLWYFGFRKHFDDHEDVVLPGVVLLRDHLRGLAIEKPGNLTADVENQIEQYLEAILSASGARPRRYRRIWTRWGFCA